MQFFKIILTTGMHIEGEAQSGGQTGCLYKIYFRENQAQHIQ